jgi:tRNA threonylcarbamoyladenosine biosynthesis protein TsaE
MTTILCSTPEATQEQARKLAPSLQKGSIIALYGDLGAGKTLFSQALARALGITEPVTSPTFTLINEYDLPQGGKLFHMDAYRLSNEAEAVGLGLEELFDEGIVIIEWADRIASLLPDDRIDIQLEHVDETQRRLTIS